MVGHILIPLAVLGIPAATVASFLVIASKFPAIERRLLIGAAIVVGNVLFFGGFAMFIFFAGDRFPRLEVRNDTSHTVVVNIGGHNARIAPGDRFGFAGSYSIRDINVATDTTPPMEVHVRLNSEFDPLGDVVVLKDAEPLQ